MEGGKRGRGCLSFEGDRSTNARLASVCLGKRLPCKIANASFISRPKPGTARSPPMTSFHRDDPLIAPPVSGLRPFLKFLFANRLFCIFYKSANFGLHRPFLSHLWLLEWNATQPRAIRDLDARRRDIHLPTRGKILILLLLTLSLRSRLYTLDLVEMLGVFATLSRVFCLLASFDRRLTKYSVILLGRALLPTQ